MSSYEQVAPRFTAFLIDIDGTVVAGPRVLPGAAELLRFAREDRRRFVFLSNNSYAWPAELATSLTALGLECREQEVVTAGHLAAERAAKLSRHGVFVMGSPSLGSMVESFGGATTDDRPDVVLVGLDRQLTYPRLSIACRALAGGARLVAVNRDWTVPTGVGLEPGVGILLAALRAYKPVRALVCGKPSPVIAYGAMQRLDANPDETLMIGDSLDVDMRMAERAGIAGALVQTGVIATPAVERAVHAAHTFADLPALLNWLRSSG